jgi:outer membrane protein assembly factor BamB
MTRFHKKWFSIAKQLKDNGYYSMKNVMVKVLFCISAISLLLAGCTAGQAATSWPGLTTGDQVVYAAYGPEIYAFNSTNSSLLWKYPEKAVAGTAYYATPALTSDGQVIVGDYKGTISSINKDTGKSIWSYKTGDRIVADLLVVDQTILVPSGDHYLYALDLTGKLLWKFKTGNPLWSQPLAVNGIVYQTAMDKHLYAISLKDGSKVWAADLGSAAFGKPVMDDKGVIYAGTLGNQIVAVNTKDGSLAWKFQTTSSIWSGLVQKDGVLYYGDLNGNFTALDTSTQKSLWQFKADGAVVSTALLLDDRLYFTSEKGTLNCLDYTGKVKTTIPALSDKLYAPPVQAGALVLVGITNQKDKILSAVNENGAIAWSFQPPN